ncbi:phosphatase PAP2 family protein [Terricaulis sp.]|uniref:phosphatase PAP2 family protein n=1 Tax=Terricaulis sp. TaxID=2768686 RepID=UPI003783E130
MRKLAFALAAVALFVAPASAQQQQAMRPPATEAPLFDGVALIGPPPAAGSAALGADILAMHPTVSAERLAQARADQPFGPWVAMQPVLGADFTEARFPRTARVFADVLAAIGPPLDATKRQWQRRRPFLDMQNVTQCDAPSDALAASGSYPSGHAAGGWSWALVMAELIPSRGDALLQRGRDYGDSRVICGFHYPSDVAAGRTIAAAAMARLHADPAFRRDMEAARRELARVYH